MTLMETGVIESQGSIPAQPKPAQPPHARIGAYRFADAVIFSGDSTAFVARLELEPPGPADVVVEVIWSGVSAGTERLMWSGEMPPFPGLSYPLVPGYEAVGQIILASGAPERVGEVVFVPGARCFRGASGLFGASASHIVVPGMRAYTLTLASPREGVLLALAATAHHAIAGYPLPELIVGHGVLGRLAARLVVALGGDAPTIWEINAARREADDYPVIAPSTDERRNYRAVCDLSGDSAIIDKVLPHCVPGAEIVLAGFYSARPSFAFPLAFMKEMRLRVAAEWTPADLDAVSSLVHSGKLSLEGLITHIRPAAEADEAYRQAFSDAACLKMLIDWRPSNV
ncbi:MAG: chlorophyll synthesis pathway protein BchC [Hyphomonas sp.]